MPRYSKELLNYIGRKLGLTGRNLDDLSSQFDELKRASEVRPDRIRYGALYDNE